MRSVSDVRLKNHLIDQTNHGKREKMLAAERQKSLLAEWSQQKRDPNVDLKKI